MQKKVGFTVDSNAQGDSLIINNGLTASVQYKFEGSSSLTFKLPQTDGSNGWALKTDGAGNLSFGTVSVNTSSGTSGKSGTSGTSGSSGTSGTSGSSGSSGSSGKTGTSGSSGSSGTSGLSDKYVGTIAAPIDYGTIPVGSSVTFITSKYLSYTSGQSIVISYDSNNFINAVVINYVPSSGQLDVNVLAVTFTPATPPLNPSQTNIQGLDGTSGTSGSDGTSGSSGLTGSNGTSGSSGSSGLTGTSGTSGINGVAGSSGTSGANGTSGSSGSSGTSGANGVGNATMLGTTNYVAKFTGATAVGNSIIQDSGTQILIPDGTNTAPSIAFATNSNTGIYRQSANAIGFASAGVLKFSVFQSYLTNYAAQFHNQDGTNILPPYTFGSDTDTGIYRYGSNQLGIAAGATAIGFFERSGTSNKLTMLNDTANLESQLELQSYNGLKYCRFFFRGDDTTTNFGWYVHGGTTSFPLTRFRLVNTDTTSNGIRLALGENANDVVNLGANANPTAGYKVKVTGKLEVSDVVANADGSISAPSLTFLNDTDTGLYRIGSGRMAYVSNGSLAYNSISNESDIFQVRGFVTASNNKYYHYALAQSGGTGVWKLGMESDQSTFTMDRWAANSYQDTFMRVTSTTASIGYRTYFNKAVNHQPVVNASVSGTYSIDMAASNVFNLTLTGNTTLTTSNEYEGSYVILITQDGTGGKSLTLHNDGRFIGSSAISISTTAGSKSIIQLLRIGTQSVVMSQKNLTAL